jgi:hypothetical protein
MYGAETIDTIDAAYRRKSENCERDCKGEREKLPPRYCIHTFTTHKNIGQMEARCYDPRHHIINSNTKYHCGECCARMNKRSNSTETVKTTLTTAGGSKW